MIHFKKEDEHNIPGRGRVVIVKNPLVNNEWSWATSYDFLVNLAVRIDGDQYMVKGVESFAYGGNRKQGESIGLLVQPWPRNK